MSNTAKGAAPTMTVLFAIAFVLLHAALVWLVPAHAMVLSYGFLVTAPVIALACAIRRSAITGFALERGWSLAAASLLLWTFGMISSLRQDLFLANNNAAPGESMLFYVLYGVPIFYAVATIGVDAASWIQRMVDAALVIILGYLYFALMFSWINLHGADSPLGAQTIAGMFDVENGFLAASTTIRFFAADTVERRHLFGTLAVFTFLYAVIAAYYNHHVALDVAPNIGNLYDPLVDIPFMLFAVLAWLGPTRISQALNPSIGLVRFVRSGSPLLLALAVLVVALLLLRPHFGLGVAGIVAAVLGYGLRSILSQVHQSKTEDDLRSDRSMFAEMAMRDGLTGVPNRRAFEEALDREWRLALRSRRSIALLLVDIDLFKQYNDRYGHLAGDACLRQVANVLQKTLRRPADMLARYGGEEFVLILPNTPGAGAHKVASRLCKQISQLDIPHEDSAAHCVTISVGVAGITPEDGIEPNELISGADRALYEAKRKGRNRVELIA
jgi:diguanylate cyclase (GGDEF)-like protein